MLALQDGALPEPVDVLVVVPVAVPEAAPPQAGREETVAEAPE
jgi:hypothetical protein